MKRTRPQRPLSERYLKFGLSSRRVEPQRQNAFHRHNEIELLLIEKGGIDHLQGGRLDRLRPGVLAVFWGAIPHAPLAILPGTVLHRLTVPLAWFLGWNLPSAFTQQVLSGKTLFQSLADEGAADLAMFRRWHEDLRQPSLERQKVVLLECEARLRRRALADAPPPGRGRAIFERGAAQVERMSRYVALHYAEQIHLPDIARDAGLNPDYAAALFRRACGLSLVDYVNEHRISHSQRLLATTDSKIVDIAFLAGFGSASRFYTAFKQACGMTPRRYRRQMEEEVARSDRMPPGSESDRRRRSSPPGWRRG